MKQIIIISVIFAIVSPLLFSQPTQPPTSMGAYQSGIKQPGGLITFTGAGSHDNDAFDLGAIPQWEWDFIYSGGVFIPNVTTQSSTVNYTYTNAGRFTVAVRYRDNDGTYGNIYTFSIDIIGISKYYYIKDHLSNIRVTVDKAGVAISAQDYNPFGDINRALNQSDPNDKYKFTEKERDKETGYDYFGARFYDPELGRWLSLDPLGDKYYGWSPYNYALNNPTKFIDPNGMEAARPEPAEEDDPKKRKPQSAQIVVPLPVAPPVPVPGNCNCSDNARGVKEIVEKTAEIKEEIDVLSNTINILIGYKIISIFMETRKSGKEKASDIPSWAEGEKPRTGESGKDYAERLCDSKYGPGKYNTGPGSEYNKLKKYGDRNKK